MENKVNLKKALTLAFTAVASVGLALGLAPSAGAAPTNLKADWTKTQCYYWNYTESTARTCFTETHPGNQPPDWDTPNYTPYLDGRGTVIYGPGAISFDAGYRVNNTKPNTVTTSTFDINASGNAKLTSIAARPARLGA